MAKYSLLNSEPRDTTITTRWIPNLWWCRCRPPEPETGVDTSTTTKDAPAATTPGCKLLDGLVGWIFHNVAAAFFASLERFSCINIDTKDDLDDNLLSDNNRGNCTLGGPEYSDATYIDIEDLDV